MYVLVQKPMFYLACYALREHLLNAVSCNVNSHSSVRKTKLKNYQNRKYNNWL